MDINNVSKTPEAVKNAEAAKGEQVAKIDDEIRAKVPIAKKNYDAISKDGDTLEISEKQIAKNQVGNLTLSYESNSYNSRFGGLALRCEICLIQEKLLN